MEIHFGRSLILDLQAAEMITLAEHVTMSFGIAENVPVFTTVPVLDRGPQILI